VGGQSIKEGGYEVSASFGHLVAEHCAVRLLPYLRLAQVWEESKLQSRYTIAGFDVNDIKARASACCAVQVVGGNDSTVVCCVC
jgi:hypothetical protein